MGVGNIQSLEQHFRTRAKAMQLSNTDTGDESQQIFTATVAERQSDYGADGLMKNPGLNATNGASTLRH